MREPVANNLCQLSKWTADWHHAGLEHWDWTTACPTNWLGQLSYWFNKLHYHNYQIWHYEDYCRLQQADKILWAKPNIDRHNQARCDAYEQIDVLLLDLLPYIIPQLAPIHGESAGMIVDRLSIIELKLWHTIELGPNYKERQLALEQQRQIVTDYLLILLDDCNNGRVRLYNFRQLKLYNDPATNPKLREAQ